LTALVEAQVARTPEAPAVAAPAEPLTYTELNARAERLADALVACGVGPETVVSVVLPRTANTVVALLGVLKAGGAYLPVDPAYATARLEHAQERHDRVRRARPASATTAGASGVRATCASTSA
ncbi:AMP-binding protein, partial [Streptomyces beijiangensis]